jgi:hypothetical protein
MQAQHEKDRLHSFLYFALFPIFICIFLFVVGRDIVRALSALFGSRKGA